ncbi:MAG: type II secretion system protein [Bacilli bacterium]|nr:type II secretion system protein [Bacilli bacterium]
MKQNKRNGFTLVELLAVIVVLGIISIIVIPQVTKTIETAEKETFKSTAMNVVRAADYEFKRLQMVGAPDSDIVFTFIDGVETTNITGAKLDYEGEKIVNGTVRINTLGKISMAIYNGTWCVQKKYDDSKIDLTESIKEDCILTEPTSPILKDGMIPVRWDGTKLVKADIYGNWYNYDNKEWANVVLVNEATRNSYNGANVGTSINEMDVLAYLVWIPRYKYKLFNADAKLVSATEIDIVFESSLTSKVTGSQDGDYLTHPAFTFGDDELYGFWIGKFETTGDETLPTIKPNITSLRNQNIMTMFTTLQKFNNKTIYGLSSTTDSHMLKNTEWGAVAYLTNSKYGKGSEVWKNPSSDYITGCSGSVVIDTASSGCTFAYNTPNGLEASTTGNIYGVYDMSGGSFEAVMGGMYNSADNTQINIQNTGFDQALIDGTTMSKYINKYNYGETLNDQDAYNRKILGDATGETRGWYDDNVTFIHNTYSWFYRGGQNGNVNAGIFSMSPGDGSADLRYSSRVSIPSK